jgi:hypothetical protein
MRSFVLLLLSLTIPLFVNLAISDAASAQFCDWTPSSCSPARGVTRGYASYPCYSGQIKADWNTMLYREPTQASYALAGYEINADIWCFDDAADAREYGFRHASN